MAVERYGEVVAQRTEAYAALERMAEVLRARDARIASLEAQLREARQTIAQGQEAHDVGRAVMARFGSRAALDQALGSGDAAGLQPGAAPVSDLRAWRQLGAGMSAPGFGGRSK